MELLLSHGADVNNLNGVGRSPFLHASSKGAVKAVNLLLSKGANFSNATINRYGRTCSRVAKDKVTEMALDRWPMTMAMLKDLSLYYQIDCSSLIDLHQYMGNL